MSNSAAYWPSEPTEMPCEPLHVSPWMTMSVLLGLKDTQSSLLEMRECWITMAEERYVFQPSVFLGCVDDEEELPMVISETMTSLLFAMRLNHCGFLTVRKSCGCGEHGET